MTTKYTIRKESVYTGADESTDDGTFTIEEDEFILDSEWRGGTRMVVAIATPVEETYRCDTCGATFDTKHGLSVHEGSQH